jgi:hypothetical protein
MHGFQSTHFNHTLMHSYIRREIENCGRDAKKLFLTTDKLTTTNVNVVLPDHNSEEELAEEFNAFFIRKIITIRDDISAGITATGTGTHDLDPLSMDTAFDGLSLISLGPVSCFTVRRILKSLPPKSCSLDPIPTELVKENANHVAVLIAEILNTSFSNGNVPPELKRAIVRPKLKKPNLDKNVMQNYRPVSNIPVLAKVMEKAVLDRLGAHLERNHLHDRYQSAYRRSHSTETALLKVQTDILRALDKGECAVLLLNDLSAAFDTIDHSTLIQRLDKSLGIRGKALKWIHSYLEGRTQQVQIGEAISSAKQLTCGVPQGSILGPILYCMYTRQMGRIFGKHGLSYHCYADDSQVYTVLNLQTDWPQISEAIEQCMSELHHWMKTNKLKLNQEKFEYQIFHPKNYDFQRNDFNLSLQSWEHTPSEAARNLGVIFDEHMTMERQINAVTRSCHYQLRSIGRIRRFLNEDACRTIVNATVTSRLDYGNALLYGVPQKHIRKLQMAQNSAARLVEGSKRSDHITPVLFRLHWLPVQYRIRFKMLTLCHKILAGNGPGYLSVQMRQPARHLRGASNHRLEVPQSSTVLYGGRCYDNAMAKEFNALPLELRAEKNHNVFKRKLKTFFFQMHFNP